MKWFFFQRHTFFTLPTDLGQVIYLNGNSAVHVVAAKIYLHVNK